jgi:general secretion pathway protein J
MFSPNLKRSNAGFTLVELLVALTIMGMVSGLMMSSISFSMKTVDTVESRIAAIESFHQSQRALRRQIQLAQPILDIDSEIPRQLDFDAKVNKLEFIAPVPGLGNGGGLYRISLRIEDDFSADGNGGRLTMSYRMNISSSRYPSNDFATNEVVLLENFSHARFSYFDTLPVVGGDWSSDWQYADRLPDLVRLNVVFDDDASDDAFDLIVAIRATAPAGFN